MCDMCVQVPAFMTYMLWVNSLGPWFFAQSSGPAEPQEETKEDRRRRERAERRARKRF